MGEAACGAAAVQDLPVSAWEVQDAACIRLQLPACILLHPWSGMYACHSLRACHSCGQVGMELRHTVSQCNYDTLFGLGKADLHACSHYTLMYAVI